MRELQTAPVSKLTEESCAGIVFAETSVLGGDATALSAARRAVAAIAYKRNGGGCAPPRIPTADELKNPHTKAIWGRCQDAAKSAGADDVQTCKHFVIWYSDDEGKTPSKKPKRIDSDWPYDHQDKIKSSWGPFTMPFAPKSFPIALSVATTWELAAGGVDNIHVMQYCGVP